MRWSEEYELSDSDYDTTPVPSFADVVRRGSSVPEGIPQTEVEPPAEATLEPVAEGTTGRKEAPTLEEAPSAGPGCRRSGRS